MFLIVAFGIFTGVLASAAESMEPDADRDGIQDFKDQCPGFNDNVDRDGDWIPDGCDVDNQDGPLGDADGDGVINQEDYCPAVPGSYGGCDRNYAPDIRPIDNMIVAEGQSMTFTMRASDANGDAITFSLENAPIGVWLQDHGDGTATFSWTPYFEQAGNYDIMVVASDGELSDKEIVTMTVLNVNRAPIMKDIEPQTMLLGTEKIITFQASEPDGEKLTFTSSSLPAGATFQDNNDGTATFDWTPTVEQLGEHQVTVSASDGQLSDSITVSITVVRTAAGQGNESPPGAADPNPEVNPPEDNNDNTPELSPEEQEYQNLRDQFEELEDDFIAAKRKYERAVAEHNDAERQRQEDSLDNTDEDLVNLDEDVDALHDDVDDNDALENQDELLNDLEDLKEDIDDLREQISSLLEGPESAAPSISPRTITAASTSVPQIRIEPLAFPPEPTPAVETSGNSWEKIRSMVWIGAGSIILLAIIIFLAALLFF